MDGEGGDLDRGPPLLPARRRRLGGHLQRAAWRDVTKGKVVEGGSTITQQVVRNLYRSRASGRFSARSRRPAWRSSSASQWSKDRILGDLDEPGLLRQPRLRRRGCVADVLLEARQGPVAEQAALLAGLPQAPSLYDPILFPATALERRAHVLKSMYDNGDISFERYQAALADHEPAPEAGTAVHGDPRAVLLQLRPRPADRRVRCPDRPVGRPPRVHDDRPRVPARGHARRSRTRSTSRTTRRPPWSRSTPRTAPSGR